MWAIFELLHIIPKEPYSSYMFGENSLEQCKSEQGEGSKISGVWYVDSDRPALGSRQQKNTEPPAQT